MSELAFARGLYWSNIVALGLNVGTHGPLWAVIGLAVCCGFLDWRVKVLWQRKS